MHNGLDISVVICTYDEVRWEYLLASIELVQNQSVPPSEIIVVVDHNQALLKRVCAHLTDIVPIENTAQQGLSGARNSGISTAKGEVIVFLDDDAIAATNWLERLTTGYEDPNIIGIGGSLEPIWLSEKPRWFPEEFNWVVGCSYLGMPQTTASMRNLIGANMSFRREAFGETNGFYVGRGEDSEFCIRVRNRWPKKELIYEPNARVFHNVTKERSSWKYFLRRCYLEGCSKAILTRRVGTGIGLASERAFVYRTLPQGIVRGFRDTILHQDINGLAHIVAILTGLTFTAVGYVRGHFFIQS